MLTDFFCVPKYTGKTFCNQTVTTGAKLSAECSWVQLQERQEVNAGASGFQGFYLKTLNYIIFINSNLFHLSSPSAQKILSLNCSGFGISLTYLKTLYFLD